MPFFILMPLPLPISLAIINRNEQPHQDVLPNIQLGIRVTSFVVFIYFYMEFSQGLLYNPSLVFNDTYNQKTIENKIYYPWGFITQLVAVFTMKDLLKIKTS